MVLFITIFVLAILIISIICLDISNKVHILNKKFMSIYLIFAPHVFLLGYFFIEHTKFGQDQVICKWIILIQIILFVFYIWLKVNIAPNTKKQIVNIRLKVMIGGKRLVLYGLYVAFIQVLIYLIGFKIMRGIVIPKNIFVIDTNELPLLLEQLL
ncbi:hypothetical protein [Clostridium estertheticum]|uniref:hypothetical protein n=1 Tax=Clostridium estertheticum TaxID=238834 RepID=UPI0014795300|nr:hypothetical protein [Clostridium estertheticum]MBZ9617644.1 hypothetical protein [Clostridium estertheticum subsp. laramiense]